MRKLFWIAITLGIGVAVASLVRRRVAQRSVGTPDHWPSVPRKNAASS